MSLETELIDIASRGIDRVQDDSADLIGDAAAAAKAYAETHIDNEVVRDQVVRALAQVDGARLAGLGREKARELLRRVHAAGEVDEAAIRRLAFDARRAAMRAKTAEEANAAQAAEEADWTGELVRWALAVGALGRRYALPVLLAAL